MKKMISILTLTAALAVPCAAGAASRSADIDKALWDYTQIHILYNDKIVASDDVKPVNKDGRVMIPFRAALESMGASVEYDGDKKLVTALRGDTTITFTLNDENIYVDKSGEKSILQMDVPMLVENDRTLVPIRFMAEAFDMSVGWDGRTQTVLIMDYDAYADELSKAAPNLIKISQLGNESYNKEYAEFNFGMSWSSDYVKNDLLVGITENSKYKDNAAGIDFDINFKSNDYEIKDAALSLTIKDGAVYVKTDLFGAIADITPDKFTKMALSSFSPDKWYKVDLNRLMNDLLLPEEIRDMIDTITKQQTDTMDFEDTFFKMFNAGGEELTLGKAQLLAMVLDTYESMDGYFTVEEKDNGEYSVKLNMTLDDLIDIVKDISGETPTEADLREINDAMTFDLSMAIDGADEKTESNVKFILALDEGGEKFDISFEAYSKAEKDDGMTPVTIPEESVDITDKIIEMMNGGYDNV